MATGAEVAGPHQPNPHQRDIRLLRQPIDDQLQHIVKAMLLRHVEQKPLMKVNIDRAGRRCCHVPMVREFSYGINEIS
jgi:hypothetical protein